jgi:hypothetical protein
VEQVSARLTREGLRRNMEFALAAAGATASAAWARADRPWLDPEALAQMHRLRNEARQNFLLQKTPFLIEKK